MIETRKPKKGLLQLLKAPKQLQGSVHTSGPICAAWPDSLSANLAKSNPLVWWTFGLKRQKCLKSTIKPKLIASML